MRDTFKQYHQFSEVEFKQLWKNCLFVLDTNTLLNMYRYSRTTVKAYFKALRNLKEKNQIWIPYQVAYEFYENRIDVISKYQSSYDYLLSIIDKAKNDIGASYKYHPFLDLSLIKKKMESGLLEVESEIKKAKQEHPKWMEKDTVLDDINSLFDGNVGKNYSNEELLGIMKDGKERYEKKIPPGYKDEVKSDDRKYGDLILWYQIIDKARESKKPIILISSDVKEDWWLEKDGKKIMPLPQLKKEIFEKAGVAFHIYTADKFLEYHDGTIDKDAIYEVRKIRELEQEKMMMKRIEIANDDRESSFSNIDKYANKYVGLLEKFGVLIQKVINAKSYVKHTSQLERLYLKVFILRDKISHRNLDRVFLQNVYIEIGDYAYFFDKILHSENIDIELSINDRDLVNEMKYLDPLL
jgi:hypothetical protein